MDQATPVALRGESDLEEILAAGDGAAAMVWREVLRGVYEGRYAAGQRLTEAELTQEYKVGRSSAREALTRLAAEGVVTLHRHRGATIRSAGPDELLDILTVLDVLIRLAARLAAEKIDAPGNREAAQEELTRLGSPDDEISQFELGSTRNRFYRTLLQLAGNAELRRVLSQVHVHSLRIQLGDFEPPQSVVRDFIGILSAVASGNPKRAEDLAKAHIATHFAAIRALTAPARRGRARTRQAA